MRYLLIILAFFSISAQAEQLNFLLIGQSNMSGRGNFSELGHINNSSKIYVYGNNGIWRNGVAYPVDDSTNQVDNVSNDGAVVGAGPGYYFANKLSSYYPNKTIGLIPCAKGGKPISSFRQFWTYKTLYGNCLKRANEAGEIHGIIFWQGESDAEDTTSAANWRERFTVLMSNTRSDLGSHKLPIVFARLNNLNPKPYWNALRSGQEEIEAPYVAMISTDGVPYASDNIHATTTAHKVIGERFADAMHDLLEK